ncbi:MAG: acyl-CoA dehydrogenase family protein [Kofleriaceae bacterium]|nr:acyl-CoA dehydrogenase family protein [Myxococcales bacterium]MCB9559444.1 acyl-CoA dehydrogenase family protein [Kofleriaceae bacterium]MCB9574259.1 acyl-CoA dehydrogenase family protein [Kofleriaceae bacterium]
MAFHGLDYYGIDELLTEEERMIRDTVRDFVSSRVMPSIGKHFTAGTFPRELIPVIGEMGLLGSSLTGHGCAGTGPVAYGLICQELERGDSGLRSFASVQSSLVMYPIWAFGSDAQKDRYLPEMAAGRLIGCFGLTEPDFGSNPAGMLTTATRVDGGYRLNGTKRWITNGSIASVALVWAKLDGKVRGFLVPTTTPGFTARDIHGKWSLRASVTSELILEDCVVPEDAILPGVEGMRGPLSCLSQARFGICFGVVGAAMACYDEALSYAKDRVQFSRPIAGYQLVQRKLVDMVSEITKAQLLNLRLGRLKEAGTLRPPQVSLAKRNNVAMARDIARDARDILGANGVTDDYQCGRHMLNLESVYTYEGTHDVHTLVVGQDVTGLAAFDG